MKSSKSFIESMLLESSSYLSMEQIQNDLQSGQDLSNHPIEPLFVLISKLEGKERSLILPRLSKAQRQSFLDIDCWDRDHLDTHHVGPWIEAYAFCQDEQIRYNFVQSASFLTFLKGRFNIWTFDTEDPKYPDHDYYFLTEDNLLLVEYDEEFLEIEEFKSLIKDLYSVLGVEGAYSYLFKYISDSFMLIEEEEYQNKRSRLKDIGIIDYFDSLEFMSTYSKLSLVDGFINHKVKAVGNLDSQQKMQNLHSYALKPFEKGFDSIHQELQSLEDSKLIEFLKFDFITSVNSKLAFDNALRSGRLRTDLLLEEAKNIILLGYSYIKEKEGSVLDKFLFTDLFKVGNSLIQIEKKKLKKELESFGFEDQKESFLGDWICSLLENIFGQSPRICLNYYDKKEELNFVRSVDEYKIFCSQIAMLINFLPFISQFYETFLSLKKSGALQDDYYLNYNLVDIDFESILISSFISNYQNLGQEMKKMGITIDELQNFLSKFEFSDGETSYEDFAKRYGMDKITGLRKYMSDIMSEHLTGYDFKKFTADDYKHVGGPIILQN